MTGLGTLPLLFWLLRDLVAPGGVGGRLRSLPLAGLVVFGVFFTTWCLDRYMPGIEHTWSQKGLFDSYYASCVPSSPAQHTLSGRAICDQRLVAYKMNWRGETFHSDNRVIPLRNDEDFEYFLTLEEGKREFFALVEYSRLESQFKSKLSVDRRTKVRRVHEAKDRKSTL